jgi:hypothetical protein
MLVLFAGITGLLFTVLQQPTQSRLVEAEQEQSTSQSEKEGESSHYFFQNYEAVVPLVQVQLLHHELSFTFEPRIALEPEHPEPAIVPFILNHFFKTLFEQIISPNAP